MGNPTEDRLERHLEALRRFVGRRMGRLGQMESVSDIVQSTCREVLAHPEWFRVADEGKFRNWVLMTAQRKILNHAQFWQAAKRNRDKLQRLDPPASSDASSVAGPIASNDRTPSGEMASREELARIAHAMETLPEDYRLALRLSREEGLSRSEIAKRMGRTEDAVRNLVSRALTRLAEALQQE